MDVGAGAQYQPGDMPCEAEMPAGRAALNRSFYGPITEAMRQDRGASATCSPLPDLEGRRDNPAELIGMLVGLDLAEPAARAGRRTDAAGAAVQPRHPGEPERGPKISGVRSPRRATRWAPARRARCSIST